MSTIDVQPASSLPRVLNYYQVLELAERLVVEEANSHGRELSRDELELKAAKRAALMIRGSF